MEKSFKNHVKSEFPFLCNSKLLLAVSGGVDSVVLTHLCHEAKLDFSIAHCNFNLRGEESDEDENFVTNLAKQLKVEIFTQSFDTQRYAENSGISVQMAARDLRYQWFDELRAARQFDYVLTAHHANDNLETFLINLIRGTGPDGLTGIKAESKNLIRPLLSYTREEIEKFAETKDLKWREDSSNFSDKYMRNYIRHHIVPGMVKLNPQMLDTFSKTQQYLRGSLELVEDYMSLLYPRIIKKDTYGYSINLDFLRKIPNPKQVMYQMLRSFGFTEWNDVYNLMDAQPGKMVFSDTHRLIKDRNTLILTEKSDKPDDKEFWLSREEELVMIPDMGTLHLEEVEKLGKPTKNCIYVPASKLQFPLHIRKWKKGDFFYPFGMNGKKKLSNFFKDEKFSLPEKENTWILCSNEEIVWIIDHRADNRFAVNADDKDILKIFLT